MKLYQFYPADPSNYTKGRGRPLKLFVVHHTAGYETTLRHLWANPARNGSSHFFVHPEKIEQYVDTDDTAWTNSYWPSNQESLTAEVRGDWRTFYDVKTLDRLEQLMYKCRKLWPHLQLSFHNKEAARGGKTTECPAKLAKYAQERWDRVTKRLADEAKPPAPAIRYQAIDKTAIKLNKVAELWDFSFEKWGDQKSIKTYGSGHVFEDVVAIATNKVGSKYYVTAYSAGTTDKQKINDPSFKPRNTHGINTADATPIELSPPTPTPTDPPKKVIEVVEVYNPVRVMETNQPTRLIDYETGKIITNFKAGHPLNDVQQLIDAGGVKYYRLTSSVDGNRPHGVPADHAVDVMTIPPQPEPQPEPEPTPEPPTEPAPPSGGDTELRSWLFTLFTAIGDAISKFLSKFKK